MKYLKNAGYFLAFIIVFSLIMSLFSISSLFNQQVITILNIIAMSLITFLLALKSGKKILKRGYLEGLKLGLIDIIILIVLNLIFFKAEFNIKMIIYYAIIIITSILGSMFGISKTNQQ